MEMTPLAVHSLASLLESRTGQQLVAGRRWRLETALLPIMRRHDIASLDSLAGLITAGRDPALANEVVEAMLNHETSFYRDVAVFQGIVRDVLPHLAEARTEKRRLRIWSAGCSTGQEAYSLAMAIAADARWEGWTIDILATDVSPASIEQARIGSYSQFEAQRGMPIDQLIAHFEQDGDAWRISDALRSRVTFVVHNLFDAPPAGRYDLVLCRNVLLYFAGERRRQVFDRLAQAVAPDGLLMLGAGETVLGQTEAFVPEPSLRGTYRAVA